MVVQSRRVQSVQCDPQAEWHFFSVDDWLTLARDPVAAKLRRPWRSFRVKPIPTFFLSSLMAASSTAVYYIRVYPDKQTAQLELSVWPFETLVGSQQA